MTKIQANAARPSPRPVAPSEYRQLWRLDQACFASGIAYGWEELRAYLGRRGAMAFALDAADGIGAFVLAQPEQRRGHIITLDVLPIYRRRGWGRLLLRTAEMALWAAGKREIRLEAAVDNRAALELYTREGYQTRRTLRGYYPGGLDGLQLVKLLPAGGSGP